MQKKALLVDNDFFFVEFLSELLTKRGYKVLKAYDGKEGIAALENETISILFADLVLPKIGGRQFFNIIRKKYEGNRFPLVALSGTMIEQLSSLQEIGADYFIAKGPIDQLTVKLNEFMAEMETKPFFPPMDKKVLATGNVCPRRDAVELLNSLMFHQAVIDCAATGIIVVDSDTRIINANQEALEIIGRSSVDVINLPVAHLFINEERTEVIKKLQLVKRQKDLRKVSLYTTFCAKAIAAIASPIRIKDDIAGWVLVLEPAFQNEV
jgi:PAS domain S-box-containing protein